MEARGQGGGIEEESGMRLSAYYYSFEPTGVPEIDNILSAVACAGKAFHNTSDWNDGTDVYEDSHRGETPIDWIQNAANDAAERLYRRTPAE